MTELDGALVIFAQEAEQLLSDMESALLILENDSADAETINSLFRAMHTIKGSAGLFGFDAIVSFAHQAESVLDKVRNHERHIDNELISILLECKDHTANLIEHCLTSNNADLSAELSARSAQLIEKLTGTVQIPVISRQHEPEPMEMDGGRVLSMNDSWLISLEFEENAFRDGIDPLSFIRYLKTLGEIEEILTSVPSMPEGDEVDPESCYLNFKIIFHSEASKKTIESVFEFADQDCRIKIIPPNSKTEEYLALLENANEMQVRKIGEILLQIGAVTDKDIEHVLKIQQQAGVVDIATVKPFGQVLIEERIVQQALVEQALNVQEQTKQKINVENNYIRVDATKLGHLIDLVGELVISTAATNLLAAQNGDANLLEANASVISLVEEVRDSALQLRMVPIGTTFSRFQRVVRDVSKELGKDIKLIISGADTEVDKTVVEKIGDPLLHLVRNAIDHGIETAEVRQQWGKPAQGVVKLNAYHSSGSIVIEVSDDGGGLNKEKIYAKAVERGLIKPEASLSDQEIYALVFEPGFSTVDQVSNLSGRGVGMDVVKRNITELRGVINIDSVPQGGSTFRIHLPLTLAIIDGFLVEIGKSSFVIPLDRVVECLEFNNANNLDYMELRGDVLPVIRLKKLFKNSDPENKRQNVIVVEHLNLKAGLVVDRLMGELQAVIKPLGKLFGHVQGIGGSTILGNGEVALIVDVPTLLHKFERDFHRSSNSNN